MSGLLITILLVSFAAIGLIFYVVLPILSSRYGGFQQDKAQEARSILEEMFLWVAYRKLVIVFGLSPIFLGLMLFILFSKIIFIIIGFVLGFMLPILIVRALDKRRKTKFRNQLIDALIILSQCLKAGLSFLQALEVLIEEMPAPMSQEMALVVKENKMGVAFEESFERLNTKMECEDLNLMITAILVARETGGNLTEVFSHLSENLRQKNRITDQVKTLTTQARWQGIIMSLLPIAFAVIMFKIKPDFFEIMMNTTIGRGLLLWCLFSEIIGAFMMLKISKVDV